MQLLADNKRPHLLPRTCDNLPVRTDLSFLYKILYLTALLQKLMNEKQFSLERSHANCKIYFNIPANVPEQTHQVILLFRHNVHNNR